MELVLLTSIIISLILGVVLGYPLFFKPKIVLSPFKKIHNESKLVKNDLKSIRGIFKLVIVFSVISMMTVIIVGTGTLDFYKEAYSILAGFVTILLILIL